MVSIAESVLYNWKLSLITMEHFRKINFHNHDANKHGSKWRAERTAKTTSYEPIHIHGNYSREPLKYYSVKSIINCDVAQR